MSIEIITGCMFSGKTTALLHRVSKCHNINQRVLVINSALDNRYDKRGVIKTHDEYSYTAVKANTIKEIDDNTRILVDVDVVAIDEGQFFADLKEYVVKFAEEYNKRVIVSGLMTDCKRQKFGHIIDLLHYTNHITYKTALCVTCGDGTKALFTKKNGNVENQIDVGSSDKYVPLCRNCYLQG